MTTYVLLITDMSGSMAPLADDVCGGFNAYLADLSKHGEYRVTVCLFDTVVTTLCMDAPLDQVPRLDLHNYQPRGMTALLDAIGMSLVDFDRRNPSLTPDDKVMCVVQTDGLENSSKEFRAGTVAELVRVREQSRNWTFLFLGAGVEAFTQARSMGFSASSTVRTRSTGQSVNRTYAGLSRATQAFAAGVGSEEVANIVASTPGVVEPEPTSTGSESGGSSGDTGG